MLLNLAEELPLSASVEEVRPVKLQLTVEESFLTTRGDDARVRIRTAVDAKGQLVARQATIHLNTGAYAENSPMVCRKAANRIVGSYRIPNVKIDCFAVYTNTAPASSYRGLGGAQVTFPGESQIDELAEKSGCDSVEFRLKNLAKSGESIHPGMRPIDADLPGDVREAARMLRMDRPLAPGHGRANENAASDARARLESFAEEGAGFIVACVSCTERKRRIRRGGFLKIRRKTLVPVRPGLAIEGPLALKR
jgi:CO/xanthine dehydrogenase Mo-binding subunit